jgi:hypothetical protein
MNRYGDELKTSPSTISTTQYKPESASSKKSATEIKANHVASKNIHRDLTQNNQYSPDGVADLSGRFSPTASPDFHDSFRFEHGLRSAAPHDDASAPFLPKKDFSFDDQGFTYGKTGLSAEDIPTSNFFNTSPLLQLVKTAQERINSLSVATNLAGLSNEIYWSLSNPINTLKEDILETFKILKTNPKQSRILLRQSARNWIKYTTRTQKLVEQHLQNLPSTSHMRPDLQELHKALESFKKEELRQLAALSL